MRRTFRSGPIEVDRPGIVVHVDGNFIHPGQGVHDQQFLLRPVQLPPGEDEIPFAGRLVLQGVYEALPLDAGHVEHIQLRDDGLQAGDLGEPHAMLPA